MYEEEKEEEEKERRELNIWKDIIKHERKYIIDYRVDYIIIDAETI